MIHTLVDRQRQPPLSSTPAECTAAHAAGAGRRFAEVLLQHYQPGDVVWVQDYHLMMLPELLKQRQPKMKVVS